MSHDEQEREQERAPDEPTGLGRAARQLRGRPPEEKPIPTGTEPPPHGGEPEDLDPTKRPPLPFG